MNQNYHQVHRINNGWSNERVEKMRAMMSGAGNPRFGVIESPETRMKKRLSHLGKKRMPHSEETKKKISTSKLGKKMSIDARRKMSMNRRGVLAYNWRGGITKIRHLFHTCLEKRIWREYVFERDGYTCQQCYQIGGKLEADHISPVALIFDKFSISTFDEMINCVELWDVNNGQTLCKKCHKFKTIEDNKNIRIKRNTKTSY